MNFVKTTALLTLMTLVVMFSATAFGFDLVSALFFALIFKSNDVIPESCSAPEKVSSNARRSTFSSKNPTFSLKKNTRSRIFCQKM